MSKKNKKENGQFYTVKSDYILEGFTLNQEANRIIEPFAGQGDLLEWLKKQGNTLPVEAYDIEPKKEGIVKRDTLQDPPRYENAFIITNPPYLARNKCANKFLFNKYDTNDLYKCFLWSLVKEKAHGGILIIPVGFFLSPRDIDLRCRDAFLTIYKLTKVKYFEEDVFPDTHTTVVAFSFERAKEPLTEQSIEWVHLPSKQSRTFLLEKKNDWIIGGDIYKLSVHTSIKIRRHVEGQKLKEGEQRTALTLTALDSGKQEGRICLEYKEGYVYKAKDTSRAYATLCIQGKILSPEEQKTLAQKFNTCIEKKREETWSLFLPQFRESKEYARKRIPFELAYQIVRHFLQPS